MASKSTYTVVQRSASGKDETLVIKGTKAEQDDDGRLVIYDGSEQVFGGISIVSWHKQQD